MKLFIFLLSFLLAVIGLQAQSSDSENLIRVAKQKSEKKVDMKHFQQQVQKRDGERKARVEKWLKETNEPARRELPNGRIVQIVDVLEGVPQVYSTFNKASAITISTYKLWPNGGLGLNLTGKDMRFGIWDGGGVRLSHQEFGGRVTQKDVPTSQSAHATHVAGTMVAAGVNAEAKGMAYQADLDAYDWNSDESEMVNAANAGLKLSNHSYGLLTGWDYDYRGDGLWAWFGSPTVNDTADHQFGRYSAQAREWDQIAYNADEYLIVKAAGNERNDDGPAAGAEYWIRSGNSWKKDTKYRKPDGIFDCIAHSALSKNVLTVGAVNDLGLGYSGPNSVTPSAFTSYGPIDDGRIKPDITANGVDLLSTITTNDFAYDFFSGTSMAAPSATGSIALLTQHYLAEIGQQPLASTLKAIVLQTADEAGENPGPDYSYGWGLLNSERAANLITADKSNSNIIQENSLANEATWTHEITVDGTEDIKVTLVWTDPAGASGPNEYNNRKPSLINDLDLRVIKNANSNEFMPWVMDPENPAAAATTGDNSVDNVEQVHIASPEAGTYTIQVTHKGTLGSDQKFSIITKNGDASKSSKFMQSTYSSVVEFYWSVPYENTSNVGRMGFSNRYVVEEDAYVEQLQLYIVSGNASSGGKIEIKGEGKLRYAIYGNDKNAPDFNNLLAHDTLDFSELTYGWHPIDVSNWLLQLNAGDSIHAVYEFIVPTLNSDLNSVPIRLDNGTGQQEATYILTSPTSVGNMFASPSSGGTHSVWNQIVFNSDPKLQTEPMNVDYELYQNPLFPNRAQLYVYSQSDELKSVTGTATNSKGTEILKFNQFTNLNSTFRTVDMVFDTSGVTSFNLLAEGLYSTMDDSLKFLLSSFNNSGEAITKYLGKDFVKFEEGTFEKAHFILNQGMEGLNDEKEALSVLNIKANVKSAEKPFKIGFKAHPTKGITSRIFHFNKPNNQWEEVETFKKGAYLIAYVMETGLYKVSDTNIELSAQNLLPTEMTLNQNYPNPFNPETSIKFYIPENNQIELVVYDALGRKVKTLANGVFNQGWNTFKWSGQNELGHTVASGVYVYQLKSNNRVLTRKMLLIK